MPRPTKRVRASRRGGINSATVRKRQKIESSQALTETFPAQIEADVMDHGMESDAPSDVELAEEDKYPIGQPKVGWESAEKALHGYSKTQVTRKSKSYHKNKDEIKRRREERKALEAGIPVTQRPKPVWGKISTFFGPHVQPLSSNSPAPTESSLGTTEPSPLGGGESPTLVASLGDGSLEQSPVRHASPNFDDASMPRDNAESLEQSLTPYVPPNFDDAFFNRRSFHKEAHDLEVWLKNQKGKVTGDWLLRVDCLRDLLKMQHRNLTTGEAARRKDWVKYSEALARRVNRSTRWAAILRNWERDWFESRSPPPCPRRGRHIKRKSLFFDEGILLAVREYLNVARWHASPKGICEVVAKELQEANAAVDIMRIDAVLHNSRTGRQSVSERTAKRWLARLGWVFGRNKKGFCDGHERPDVIDYREKVFCPRMKVSYIIIIV
jgi:hypothetical protein